MRKKVFLNLSLLVSLIVFCSNAAFAATVAYWQFENNYDDSSGNDYTLTPNYEVFTFENTKHNDAPGQYSIKDPGTPFQSAMISNYTPPLTNFTVELFVSYSFTTPTNLPSPVQDYFISTLRRVNGARDGWFGYFTKSGKIEFKVFRSATEYITLTSANEYNYGQWHHIALTIDDTNYASLYVDGELVSAKQAFAMKNSDSIMLARDYYEYGFNGFNGYIDEVRVSDTALTSSEFLNYSQPAQPVPEPATLVLLVIGTVSLIRRISRRM